MAALRKLVVWTVVAHVSMKGLMVLHASCNSHVEKLWLWKPLELQIERQSIEQHCVLKQKADGLVSTMCFPHVHKSCDLQMKIHCVQCKHGQQQHIFPPLHDVFKISLPGKSMVHQKKIANAKTIA